MEIKLKPHGRYNRNIKITIDNPGVSRSLP